MNDFIAFVDGPIKGTELIAVYNPGLVLLSYLVASFAAYTALDFAGRVSESGASKTKARGWLLGGGFAMGTGIWGMHFIAMLAFGIPVSVRYDLKITLLSLAAGILLSGFALATVTRGSLPKSRLLIGGVIMGLGVVTMHYTGMAAMRMEAVMLYRPALFALSVLNAIICSAVALWLVFHLGAKPSIGRPIHYKIGAALVMGVAICGMHYTGMYAGICVSPQPVGTSIAPLDPVLQSLVIGGVALLFMTVLLAVSIQNQIVSTQLKQQNVQLTNEIAERRRAERAMAEAKDVAEAANQAKSQFLANMSHEIRTPMNGVLGMASLLLNTELSSTQLGYAQTIKSSGLDLLTIINDILDFSKIEAGKMDLEQIDFLPRKLVGELTALLASPAQAKGLELKLNVDASVPDEVTGDPTRLRQVLTNLVSNAIKFSQTGAVTINIATQSSTVLHFAVTDHGVGITEEQKSRLFKPFSQADATTTRKYGGTGLGLVIAKNLVQLMGGQIGVDSVPGKGSTFWFTLPFMQDAKKSVGSGASAPSVATAPKLSGHVLLVEDNPVNQAVAVAMLKSIGLAVNVASDGRQAVTEYARQNYDLILMDCQMPEMDGFQATAEIRRRESDRHIPIIALTANAMAGDRERCVAAGMDDYLSKPFEEDELRATLTNWLNPRSGSGDTTASVQAVPPPAHYDVLDDSALDRIRAIEGADTDLLQQVILLYLDSSPKLLLDMAAGVERADNSLLTRAAHTLKSSSANLGASRLVELCREVEARARDGRLMDAPQWIALVETEYARVRAALSHRIEIERSATVVAATHEC